MNKWIYSYIIFYIILYIYIHVYTYIYIAYIIPPCFYERFTRWLVSLYSFVTTLKSVRLDRSSMKDRMKLMTGMHSRKWAII